MIQHATSQFDFSQLQLSTPSVLQDGSFFTKIVNKEEGLYMYTPKCSTKQGVVTSGSKQYMDIILNSSEFIAWVDGLEEKLEQLLFEKRSAWFVDESLEMDDIQNAFMPILKLKNTQHVLRAFFPVRKQSIHEATVSIYDIYEKPLEISSIKEDSKIISILDFSGVSFNQKSFQVSINIRQIMVLEKTPFSSCMIKLKENEGN
jgi:hypothetical protein